MGNSLENKNSLILRTAIEQVVKDGFGMRWIKDVVHSEIFRAGIKYSDGSVMGACRYLDINKTTFYKNIDQEQLRAFREAFQRKPQKGEP